MSAQDRYAPLAGLRVLDLTQQVAGPYCTKLMADLGAEVIKVERPGRGDVLRGMHLFDYLNAGKRSVTIDASTAAGRDLILRLAQKADVVVESFRPGTMAKWRLDFDLLVEVNPTIVLTSVSTFGQVGPYRDRLSSELILQSLGGIVFFTGSPERAPRGISLPVAQCVGGLTAYVATLSVMVDGVTPRRAEWIDVSILESLLSLQDPLLTQYAYSGHKRYRAGRRGVTSGPGMGRPTYPKGVMPCRDGHVYVLCVVPEHWVQIAAMIGRPELADDSRYSTPEQRLARADEIDALLGEWLVQHDAPEIFEEAQRRRLPFGMLASPAMLLKSRHLNERKFFRQTASADGETLRVPGLPFRPVGLFEQPPQSVSRLGAHNSEVLGASLGLTPSEIATLAQQGVI